MRTSRVITRQSIHANDSNLQRTHLQLGVIIMSQLPHSTFRFISTKRMPEIRLIKHELYAKQFQNTHSPSRPVTQIGARLAITIARTTFMSFADIISIVFWLLVAEITTFVKTIYCFVSGKIICVLRKRRINQCFLICWHRKKKKRSNISYLKIVYTYHMYVHACMLCLFLFEGNARAFV